MESGVFLLHPDNSLVRMDPQAYDAESLLQQLLTDHPELLAGDQIDPETPRRFLLVQPEIGIPEDEASYDRWYLDHLFIDQDAIPTLVEVKRATDSRIRREVVAQMLDYAANATEYWPIEGIRARFTGRCQLLGLNSELVVSEFLGPEADPEEFWQAVKANLSAGRVRLIFVADQIPQSLRRIVEFLNRQMSLAEVLAVEVRQYAPATDSPMRTLVPRVIGRTEQARQHKEQTSSSKKRVPLECSNRDDCLAACEESARPVVERILDASMGHGYVPEYFAGGNGPWVRLKLEEGSSAPINLDKEFLWVSLVLDQSEREEPETKQALLDAIRLLVPTNDPDKDSKKRQVGLRYDKFDLEHIEKIDKILTVTKAALIPTD